MFPENFSAGKREKSFTQQLTIYPVKPSHNPPPGTPFFPIRTIPNPGIIQAPIPHFSGTEPYTRSDSDPPTPCLVRKSWKFFANRGSGSSFHVGYDGNTTEITRIWHIPGRCQNRGFFRSPLALHGWEGDRPPKSVY
jgi:hypothetical protein